MIALQLAEVAAVTGRAAARRPRRPSVVTAVEFDSRTVGPGDLFVALPGERVDGHDFPRRRGGRGAPCWPRARSTRPR